MYVIFYLVIHCEFNARNVIEHSRHGNPTGSYGETNHYYKISNFVLDSILVLAEKPTNSLGKHGRYTHV